MKRFSALTLLALLTGGATACITHSVRTPVVQELRREIFLRGDVRNGEPVSRGYDHPKVIASVRLAHILSRIDLRTEAKKGTKRVPAIETDEIYPLAEGISKALEQADPSQEVVVMAQHESTSLFIFDHYYLTSFVVYAKDDVLYLRFSHVDWEIPPRRKDNLPEPEVGDTPRGYRAIASEAMSVVDEGSVAVDWRDPIFRKPTRTSITPGGKVVRRTILMEELPEADEDVQRQEEAIPPNLSPETLRRLADLEEARRNGEITESEYVARRRGIIRSDPAAPH